MNRPPNVVLFIIPYAGYDRAVLRGIAAYARHHGPWGFYVSGEYPGLPMPQAEAVSVSRVEVEQTTGLRSRVIVPDLTALGADGVIGRFQSPKMRDQILKAGIPAVAMDLSTEQQAPGSPLAEMPNLHPDSRRMGQIGAEHFLERGFQHFAFCGYAGRVWSEERQVGFCERLEEALFSCHVYEPPRRASRQTWSREQPILRDWVAALPRPVGIMTANDIRGRRLLEACQRLGAMVPDEIAVLGTDNDVMLCDLATPPLSSIAMDAEGGGYAAAELLDRMMSGEKPQAREILVEPIDVVARRSTEAIAIEDQVVSKALRFIRENAQYPIGVADVTAKVNVSQRTLQVRFQRALGHPIRVEIQRVRLRRAKRLLLETGLPVWKVAEASGFNSLTYLERLFRRENGISLGKYRRQHRLG